MAANYKQELFVNLPSAWSLLDNKDTIMREIQYSAFVEVIFKIVSDYE